MLKILLSYIILSAPLGLNWEKEYVTFAPTIPEYSHYYGNLGTTEIVYIGTKNLLSMETEAQIRFYNRKISEVLLILGPAGISSHNCLRKYKQVISLISKKYGNKKYVLDEKTSTLEELVYFSACKPFTIGLRKITTIWHSADYIIEAKLLGEYHNYFIEIRYIRSTTEKEYKRNQKIKIMKRL